jgi:hypothetical protein
MHIISLHRVRFIGLRNVLSVAFDVFSPVSNVKVDLLPLCVPDFTGRAEGLAVVTEYQYVLDCNERGRRLTRPNRADRVQRPA